jgi:multiple sugar transport system permease protein
MSIIVSKRRKLIAKPLFYLLLVIICVLMIFPFYWMIVGSLQTTLTMFDKPRIVPAHADLIGYISLAKQRPVFVWLRNSLTVGVGSVLIATPIAVLAGVSLSRYRYRFRNGILYVILFTQLLPTPVLLIPLYLTMLSVHLTDALLGLMIIDVGLSLPLSVWMMKNFFDYIPKEVEESAKIDGCSDLAVLWRIYLPLSLPGLMTIVIFIFTVAWGEYVFSYNLIMTTKKWVYTIALPSFRGEYDIQWNQLMAATILFALPVVILFLAVQRYFISGLTKGAVKG